ncbi:MAG: ABC transporter substrate-binding protein [Exiguobacterium sp.]|uniref:ABC transporter substrate-binding protein n=1 Tax=Exiguobacterium alkaliphilum TaxID=1428684 RepID=A0ABT2L1Q0_9BACL|nr:MULTISPECIES: ABC transporter substrate-binding protein [Exiguobacterium]MCT4795795.1 ABC transporter substrate-binding protein [Exiguobacterium alkaliphilum]MDX5324529.1 ABC transporter substrate-binding protein [Exiguobacterium sp.]MDX5426373.1 ABC transporter substrate-binding protein [Exiguobacterium sp.]MDX6773746.1 ABC transporter substrate-binding protein [Exiguobacterium sp.]
MNPKLVSIYRYAIERDREDVTLREAVNATGYSEKQIKRDVNVWAQSGWVEYRPGRGRGHESVIQFAPSFNQVLTTWVDTTFARITMAEAAKWLEWEWPPLLREKIQAHIWGRFGFEQTEEDRFIFPRTRALASLDPLDIHIAMEASLARHLFDRLFEWDGNVIRPSLAHHIEATRFGFRLYIRKGVLFHNGMSLSANEIVYSLNRLLRYGKQRWLFAPIERVDSPAPFIVDIYTSAHGGYIERLLAQTPASISYKGFEGTVGTGPFKLERVSEDVTRFQAFERGLRPRPSLDVVEFVTFSEADHAEWSMRDDHRLVKWVAEAGARYAVFNMRHSWLKDAPDVRRAILRTIDKTALVALGGERHQVAHGFFPEASQEVKREAEDRIDVRPIRLLHLPYATATEDANLIAQQLTFAGFTVETEVYTLSVLFEEETLRRADIILCGEMMNEDRDLAFLAFMTSELSLVGKLLGEDATLRTMMDRYHQVDLDVWPHLHREVERYVTEQAYVVPLYHVARERRFPSFLGDVPIDIYGHPRYEQLWIRPSL